MPYSPALDGLRAVCLLAVLFFHSPFAWMSGGFLGVSTFFTLSGYLITTLLIREWRETNRIAFRAFWERRLRRLGPALWLGVVVALAIGFSFGVGQPESLLGDAIASLLYWSNWRFMTPEYSYALLFEAPSLLQHTWSLSIEGQFYLAFPIILGLTLRRGDLRLAAACIAGAVALSGWAGVADPQDPDAINRVYYGTLSRAAEPLVGALLAIVIEQRGAAASSRRQTLEGLAGVAAALGMAALWSQSEVVSPWLYRGGFVAHGLLSALVINAALVGGSAVERTLSCRPLPWLGRLSYGAYVYHWPIFLLLTEERVGVGGYALFAVRGAATIVAAQISLILLEQGVRRQRVLETRRAIVAASVVAPLLVAAAASIVVERPATPEVTEAVRVTQTLGRPPAVSIYGDSTALHLAGHLEPWLEQVGVVVRPGKALRGCALINRGQRYDWDKWRPEYPRCRNLMATWRAELEKNPVDVAIVLVGPWEVLTRRLRRGDTPRSFGDPVYDEVFFEAANAAVTLFQQHGTKVIWLAPPRVRFPTKNRPDAAELREANDPARMERLRELIHTLEDEWPEWMRVVDLAGYIDRSQIDLESYSVYPDGVHLGHPTLAKIVQDWLGSEVVRELNQLLESRPKSRPG